MQNQNTQNQRSGPILYAIGMYYRKEDNFIKITKENQDLEDALPNINKDLHYGNIKNMDLSSRNLANLDFSNVDFGAANLTGASLFGCDLRGADLSQVIGELNSVRFSLDKNPLHGRRAQINKDTKFPNDFKLPNYITFDGSNEDRLLIKLGDDQGFDIDGDILPKTDLEFLKNVRKQQENRPPQYTLSQNQKNEGGKSHTTTTPPYTPPKTPGKKEETPPSTKFVFTGFTAFAKRFMNLISCGALFKDFVSKYNEQKKSQKDVNQGRK